VKENKQDKMLTDVELELMTILWKLGEGSVSEVMKHLPEGRDLAYTSVSTILRILEQKEVLKTRAQGRGHIYIPLLQKSAYESKTVKHVLDKVFDSAPAALVRQLLDSAKIDDEELQEIKKLLTEFRVRK
jgi:predicted transcriptional regulator